MTQLKHSRGPKWGGLAEYLEGLNWGVVPIVALVVGAFAGAFLKEAAKDLYSRLFRKQVSAERPEAHISSISFRDVMDSLSKAPPMQRDSLAKSYVGVRVKWELQFQTGTELMGKYTLTLGPPSAVGEPFGVVQCEVPAKDHPELRVLPRGAAIRVTGAIKTLASLPIVTLSNAQIEVLQ